MMFFPAAGCETPKLPSTEFITFSDFLMFHWRWLVFWFLIPLPAIHRQEPWCVHYYFCLRSCRYRRPLLATIHRCIQHWKIGPSCRPNKPSSSDSIWVWTILNSLAWLWTALLYNWRMKVKRASSRCLGTSRSIEKSRLDKNPCPCWNPRHLLVWMVSRLFSWNRAVGKWCGSTRVIRVDSFADFICQFR